MRYTIGEDHDEPYSLYGRLFGRVPVPIWGFVIGALVLGTFLDRAGYNEELQLVHEDDGMVEFTTSEGEVVALEEWRREPGPDPWIPLEAAGVVGVLVLGLGSLFAGQMARHSHDD